MSAILPAPVVSELVATANGMRALTIPIGMAEDWPILEAIAADMQRRHTPFVFVPAKTWDSGADALEIWRVPAPRLEAKDGVVLHQPAAPRPTPNRHALE